MNILHVSLGLPPLRTGGLTRYCTELMEAQVASGDHVSLLFPGRFLPGKTRLQRKDWRGVEAHEIINPLPVALTYGIANPGAFIAPCRNTGAFMHLLDDAAPDVIHIHSFMGVYREFFHAAKASGIPMVFTTHDYYPICPRCTLIDAWGQNCIVRADAGACSACCRNGINLRKSMVMQSGLYARLKSSPLYNKFANIMKRIMTVNRRAISESFAEESYIDDYCSLLNYNREIFELFDLVLANSRMTEEIYHKSFPNMSYRLARISHAGLLVKKSGQNIGRTYSNEPLIIGYFGGRKEYKGFKTLLEALRILHGEGIKYELRLFGDDYGVVDLPGVKDFGRVGPDKMNDVLDTLDLTIVPSICHETFSFVVLESLCAGVSVICSDSVGASELLEESAIFRAGDPVSLVERIKGKIAGRLRNQYIPKEYPLSMEQQVGEIRTCYEEAEKEVTPA